MSIHKFGNVEVDTSKLPQASVDALVKRGLSHFFGNEIASKLTGKKQRHLDDKERNPEGTPLTDDEVSSLREGFIESGFKALMEGTVGQHTPRAAVDPLEAEMRKIAAANVRAILSAQNIKAPKKDETVTLKGVEYTMEALVDRNIAKNEADITKQAKAALREKDKRKSAAAAASVDDLGL